MVRLAAAKVARRTAIRSWEGAAGRAALLCCLGCAATKGMHVAVRSGQLCGRLPHHGRVRGLAGVYIRVPTDISGFQTGFHASQGYLLRFPSPPPANEAAVVISPGTAVCPLLRLPCLTAWPSSLPLGTPGAYPPGPPQ